MKRSVKWGGGLAFSLVLAIGLFFFAVAPARAPMGGRHSMGNRTIASLQEEDFDRRLLNLQLCHGVSLEAEGVSAERRRVCKAILLQSLDTALAKTGTTLRAPLEFRCDETALRNEKEAEGTVALRPNEESHSIQAALEQYLTTLPVQNDQSARDACEFLTGCKWALRPASFSFRKIGSCLSTGDGQRRKILLDEIGARVFRLQGARPALYSGLLDAQ